MFSEIVFRTAKPLRVIPLAIVDANLLSQRMILRTEHLIVPLQQVCNAKYGRVAVFQKKNIYKQRYVG